MAKEKKESTMQEEASQVIPAPNIKRAMFFIRGTTPYVCNAFGAKAREQMKNTQLAGSTGKKGKKREAKDFKACFEEAKHVSREGWLGFPASCIRAAMISACRIVGFKMTLAKLGIFVEQDGFDRTDGTPLVQIRKGKPEYVEHTVRLVNGACDLRARPMWQPGWEATLVIRYDADMFTENDVCNLLIRVGQQVGIGEGRPDSKKSSGMGWGCFEIVNTKRVA